ncbi:MAG: hypothetical protein HMLIMOIP_002706 [Candidatus Nitrosomirales archaeon]|jgi:hypothetical protein
MKKFAALIQDPKFLRHFHGYATLLWMALLVPSLLFWSESVTWLVLMSVWANIAGHWSSWQGARAEVKVEENGN